VHNSLKVNEYFVKVNSSPVRGRPGTGAVPVPWTGSAACPAGRAARCPPPRASHSPEKKDCVFGHRVAASTPPQAPRYIQGSSS